MLAVAALLPLLAGDYALSVLTEIAISVLFAASLHFIMGPGGMATFGHAAYFGLGAYGAALAVKHLAAADAAGPGRRRRCWRAWSALLFGWFCVRLSGVYLAMLTLAFAQIVWSVAFQWVERHRRRQRHPRRLAGRLGAPRSVFYYLTLALCAGGDAAAAPDHLRAVRLRAAGAARFSRCAPRRSGSTPHALAWLAFALAGAMRRLSPAALFAYAKGSVFPTFLGIPRWVDALLMVLLGGVQTLAGPIVGALAYTGLQEQLVRLTELWRLMLGVIDRRCWCWSSRRASPAPLGASGAWEAAP